MTTKFFRRLISCLLICTISLLPLTQTTAFAAGNLAFSVGCDYRYDDNLNEIDTRQHAINSCDYYALAGYISRYTANPTVSKIRATYSGTKLMESDIVMMSGHGTPNRMKFNSGGQGGEYCFHITEDTSYYNPIPLSSFNMNNVKLMILAGCQSALGSSNITKTANNLGAKASIGWTVLICPDCVAQWLSKFNNHIALGYSVQAAFNYANSFYYDDGCVRNSVLYGNGSQVLKRNASNSRQLQTNTEYKLSNTAVSSSKLADKETVRQLIKSVYPEFSFEDFEINITDRGNESLIISIDEKIGNFKTTSAYVMFWEKGKVTEIYDRTQENSRNINKLLCSININDININDFLEDASRKIPSTYTLLSQEYDMFIEKETGKRYIRVCNSIEDDTDTMYREVHKYMLD